MASNLRAFFWVRTSFPSDFNCDLKQLKRKDENKLRVRTSLDSVVDSALDSPYEWVVYDEMCQSGSLQYVKRCSAVSAVSVALFTGQLKMSESSFKAAEALFEVNSAESGLAEETTWFKVDSLINFKTDKKVGSLNRKFVGLSAGLISKNNN